MKRISILFLWTLITLIARSESPVEVPKALRSELKKVLQTEDYILNRLDVPAKSAINGSYYVISGPKTERVRYVYSGRVNTRRSNHPGSAGSDFFDYFIFYTSNVVIEKVKIIRYQSSHGGGITSPGWLKQFRGYDGRKLLVVGKNVDAISGATISVNNLAFDIQSKTQILLSHVSD
jgi:hypothetical protein